jgi:hypothetical protein
MAVTIATNNANGDSVGINVAGYLAGFDATCAPVGFEHLSTSSTDVFGNQVPTSSLAP